MSIPDSSRILIDSVSPLVNNGLYPVKRELGEYFRVTADIFRDGHDRICARLMYRHQGTKTLQRQEMSCFNQGLDLWNGGFEAQKVGIWEYQIEAFCDFYSSWVDNTRKKHDAGVEFSSDIAEGIELLRRYSKWVDKGLKRVLKSAIERASAAESDGDAWGVLSQPGLVASLAEQPDPATRVVSEVFRLRVDPERARFAAWYECFPRSCGYNPGEGGTFNDVATRLPEIKAMGFDVLYFPPIHPIGFTRRKGPNNSLVAGSGDPGCPYSIGSAAGGHYAVEPALGSMEDFTSLVQKCTEHGLEVAIDFAINCSPDHPYLKDRPDWFSHRPDGTIKFAENPPKKYEDIYPLNFDTHDRKGLWNEMKRVILFWCKKGVRIFRVDNPHTKPFRFWQWLIEEVQKEYPDATFLSEAFTRPKVMKALAKLGFTQSYSYFTWRNTKQELIEYFSEITTPPESDFMRANLFVNTPDIFPEFLQTGGRAGYKIRAILAATLSSVYGVFQGFELCDGEPIPGREEYKNSDKYQIVTRDWNAPGNIKDYITLINRVRREYKALQEYDNLSFYKSDDENLLFYGKSLGDEHLLVVVNLDPHNKHHSFVYLPIERFGLGENDSYQVHDLITDRRYLWRGSKNYVELDPKIETAHLFRLART